MRVPCGVGATCVPHVERATVDSPDMDRLGLISNCHGPARSLDLFALRAGPALLDKVGATLACMPHHTEVCAH